MAKIHQFQLNNLYAKIAAKISKTPIEETLMEFTQFWRRAHDLTILRANKIEWSFEPATPQWRELCNRINHNEPADIVAYDLYLRNNNNNETGKKYFGCFRYDFIPEVGDIGGMIKIHFKNRDTSGEGPLSKERQHIRLCELKQMFEFIYNHHPEATVVRGGSWLYNLKSYQRLFPKMFITSMEVEEIPFPKTSGIWGQFLNSEGNISEKIKDTFLRKVDNSKNIGQLLQCFEFKILFPKTKIEEFYSYFSII